MQTTTSHTPRLQALANHIEGLHPSLFTMTSWGQQKPGPGPTLEYNPNTPACVGAWAVRLFGTADRTRDLYTVPGNGAAITDYAREVLNLTEHQADLLFLFAAWSDQRPLITPRDAARTIRAFIATGTIRYPDRRPLIRKLIRPAALPLALFAMAHTLLGPYPAPTATALPEPGTESLAPADPGPARYQPQQTPAWPDPPAGPTPSSTKDRQPVKA